jgi:hypothetical protein
MGFGSLIAQTEIQSKHSGFEENHSPNAGNQDKRDDCSTEFAFGLKAVDKSRIHESHSSAALKPSALPNLP